MYWRVGLPGWRIAAAVGVPIKINISVAKDEEANVYFAVSDDIGLALQQLGAGTKSAWATGVPEEALANATPYLQAFGHVVLAWLWLDVALAAQSAPTAMKEGKLAAMRYFYAYELPKIGAWLGVVASRESVCRDMQDPWF